MMRVAFAGLAAILVLSSIAVAEPAPVGKLTWRAPDLYPIPRIQGGWFSVLNGGGAAAPASIVTVECNVARRRGGCPEIPPRFLRRYEDPAYPNKLVIHVPPLPAGHVHNHFLAFWWDLPPGSYTFSFRVDAASAIAESNEANNSSSHIWTVPVSDTAPP